MLITSMNKAAHYRVKEMPIPVSYLMIPDHKPHQRLC